ncbi:hypothetical protein OS493_033462 [Desmophyllum pertusum]|uniref:Synaptic plasticity regulator PANTS n=1 Tax=Desmophyllum pertusum TaxID=174260 RepID=A0A9W9ZY39_9CNID|nr:hypothetical protein OS493_033462 [Desmophyllum pertusum]
MSSIFGEEDEKVKAPEFKRPNCNSFFDKWRFCRSARNQFHRYYIYGSWQECSLYWKAFQSCMKIHNHKIYRGKGVDARSNGNG